MFFSWIMERCIRPCNGWKHRDGLAPNGVCPRTAARHGFVRSQRFMFRRRRPQSDFSAELQAHLEIERDRLRAEGLSEDEAEHVARKNLGNLAAAEEHFYESSRWLWLEHMAQDTRHALRRLLKAPVFAITA